MEFKYTVNPDSNEPIMLINKHIGFDKEAGEGINGADFEKELLFLDSLGKKRIQVWINSYGGRVKDGYSIFNAILKSITQVDTICTGIAASIAGVIFQAGQNRIMNDFSILMYHNPYNADEKDMDDEDRKMIESMRNSIATMVAGRAKKSLDDVLAMMNDSTFFDADIAKKTGFCDRVEMCGEVNTPSLRNIEAKAAWKLSEGILNKLTTKINIPHMNKEVCNALGLNENSNDSVIVNAIAEVKNKYAAAQTDVKNLTDKLEKAEAEKKTLSDKITAVENKAKEDAEAAKKVAAKNLVAPFVKTGQVANDPEVINKWEEKAEVDFDGIKAMLEKLPILKKSPLNIVDEFKGEGTLNMAATMAGIAQKNNK